MKLTEKQIWSLIHFVACLIIIGIFALIVGGIRSCSKKSHGRTHGHYHYHSTN